MEIVAQQALSGLRVVEYGHLVSAPYATKLLADLGADVVKVEPPYRGDSARYRGPYPGDRVDPERSGLFLYLNANKRGVTLDVTTEEGKALLARLAQAADVFVHNVDPPEMPDHGISYERLARENPGLVLTSVTPFGVHGPKSDHAATDLTMWNAGGVAALNGGGPGTDEMPPLKAFGSQAGFQGGVNAALATLGAVFERTRSGLGQHVDVSIQECLVSILELTFEYWPYQGLIASRLGAKPIQPLDFLECADGWIFLCCVEEHQWRSFVDLMDHPEWADMELFENRMTRAANWDALKLMLNEWTQTRNVDELYRAAQARRIPIAPVSTMGDLLASPQLRSRGFFATIGHPSAGEIEYPGAPYLFSATPWSLRRPAPLLGQHNVEVYGEWLGVAEGAVTDLHGRGVV